jgi:hypothetical protein
MMDISTRKLLIENLRDPSARKVANEINTAPQNGLSISSASPYRAENPLSSQRGLNTGYGSIELNNRELSLQKNGSLGDGFFHTEITKPHNNELYGKAQYVVPHKNGYLEATGNLSPQDRSLFLNYKTNF